MAKKQKPFATFETKEEFDKHIDRILETGRERGFSEGRVWVLSYFNELISELFTPQEIMQAELETKHRHIEEWRTSKEVETLKRRLDLKKAFKELG